MLIKYLMLVAAIGGLTGLFFSKDNFARGIALLMLATIGLAFIPKAPELVDMPFLLYVVALALVLLYLLLKKGIGRRQRILMLLVTLPLIVANVFVVQHYPHALEVKAVTLISLIACIIIGFRVKNYRNQACFLIIMAFDALIHVLIAAKAIIPLIK